MGLRMEKEERAQVSPVDLGAERWRGEVHHWPD